MESLSEKKQRDLNEKKTCGGETSAFFKHFKCGELGHYANECKNNVLSDFKCGKTDCECLSYQSCFV